MLRYGRNYDARRAERGIRPGFGGADREQPLYDRYAAQARGAGMGRQHAGGWIHSYDREYAASMRGPRGGGRFTGMESNRARGVYGSDYRFGERNAGNHGGRGGRGGGRGAGMNPGVARGRP